MQLVIEEIGKDLPGDFANLLSDSHADGYRFLLRLQTDFLSGANRFAGPGERLLEARNEEALIGMGGINIDPYLRDGSSGRIRHLYVHSAFRRKGVASAILRALETGAAGRFMALTLRTDDPDAARFYQASGFVRITDHIHVTHRKTMPTAYPAPRRR